MGPPSFPSLPPCFPKLFYVEYFDTKPKKQKYGHVFTRPISTYLNDLIGLGCEIKEIIEPRLPSDADESRNKHVPQFIIIKARKKLS